MSSVKRSRQKVSVEDAEIMRYSPKEGTTGKVKATLPMPPGYTNYPKVSDITKAINDSGLSSVVMKEAEVGQLMDLLCWDGRVTKVMGGQAYKSVRSVYMTEDERYDSSLAEPPCGQCPAFDFCEEGGPVNAQSCIYFQKWLEL